MPKFRMTVKSISLFFFQDCISWKNTGFLLLVSRVFEIINRVNLPSSDREFRKQQMLNRTTQLDDRRFDDVLHYSSQSFAPSSHSNPPPTRYTNEAAMVHPMTPSHSTHEQYQQPIRPLMSAVVPMSYQSEWSRQLPPPDVMSRNSFPPTNLPPPHLSAHIQPQRPARFEAPPFRFDEPRPPLRYDEPPRQMRFEEPHFRGAWNEVMIYLAIYLLRLFCIMLLGSQRLGNSWNPCVARHF